MIATEYINLSTRGFTDIIDITGDVEKKISQSGLTKGVVTVFVPGATGGLTTIEYEPGLLKDLPKALEKIAPEEGHYHHHETWNDGNGSAHIRAALMGPSISAPFLKGKMTLGTWQQVIFCDFDNKARSRRLIVQIIGE